MFIKAIHAGATEKTDTAPFEQKCWKAVQKSLEMKIAAFVWGT